MGVVSGLGSLQELLDPQALPIVDNDGKAVEAAQVIADVDQFAFCTPLQLQQGKLCKGRTSSDGGY